MKLYTLLPLLLIFIFSSAIQAQEITTSNENKPGVSSAQWVPDIALNTDFSGVYRNLSQSQFDSLEIPGYGTSGFYSDTLNPSVGFNFNYSELSLSSAVDPYFDFYTAFHLTVDSFEIEEAYARTLALPQNFQIKIGKFLSSFGRFNELHAHRWDFSDQPLVYHAMFGAENLNELGIKLAWLVPTPFYLLIGVEVLSGENQVSFGTAGFSDPAGANTVNDGISPNLYAAYIKSSFDTKNLIILLGVSGATGTLRVDEGISDPGGYGVSGASNVLGVDLTLKLLLDSSRYIVWQTEFLYRNVDGKKYMNDGSSSAYLADQSGLYSQLVFQVSKGWRMGARFDLLQKNTINIGGVAQNISDNLARYTVMLEHYPSEFSRFRLQYNYDASGYIGNEVRENHQIALSANFNIGSHGAHTF